MTKLEEQMASALNACKQRKQYEVTQAKRRLAYTEGELAKVNKYDMNFIQPKIIEVFKKLESLGFGNISTHKYRYREVEALETSVRAQLKGTYTNKQIGFEVTGTLHASFSTGKVAIELSRKIELSRTSSYRFIDHKMVRMIRCSYASRLQITNNIISALVNK